MSDRTTDNAASASAGDVIVRRIRPQEKDLGEFTVRRVLPTEEQRQVGPFVFFDHMGPATFPPGRGIDVRPHPHIGIATITYLFEGEILHRDSLGVVQRIQPGAINLMVAGRGIVHSERPGDDLHQESRLHGIQSWMALPEGQEEIEPVFTHYTAEELPIWQDGGVLCRLIMGELAGRRSPVTTYSRTLYADLSMERGAAVSMHAEEQDLAVYVAAGEISVNGEGVSAGVMVTLQPDHALSLSSAEGARVMLIGGDRLSQRHMFWNFVHSDPERIERAKDDWREWRFPPVPDDDERIPLPGEEQATPVGSQAAR